MPRKRKRSPVNNASDVLLGKDFKSPFEVPEKPKRDSRRGFTASQQKQILHQQDYKCARCHKKLDLRATQFDHKKPWASGGRTITENGRALCSNCHSIVTHKSRYIKTDKKRKRKPKDPFALF